MIKRIFILRLIHSLKARAVMTDHSIATDVDDDFVTQKSSQESCRVVTLRQALFDYITSRGYSN